MLRRLAVVLATLGLLFTASPAVGTALAAPSAAAITSAQCDAQVNDTPAKLVAVHPDRTNSGTTW